MRNIIKSQIKRVEHAITHLNVAYERLEKIGFTDEQLGELSSAIGLSRNAVCDLNLSLKEIPNRITYSKWHNDGELLSQKVYFDEIHITDIDKWVGESEYEVHSVQYNGKETVIEIRARWVEELRKQLTDRIVEILS